MKTPLIIIILVVSFGVIFTQTGMGEGGFISAFLAAFGLIMLFAVLAFMFFAKKQAKKPEKKH